jgi:chemotaxis protein MotB
LATNARPIIVKRIKHHAHGGHGGAWKVAYADFVTAMMAFFLLLWLLSAVSDKQLQGISNYFAPISTRANPTGSSGLMTGPSLADGDHRNTVWTPGTKEKPGAADQPPEDDTDTVTGGAVADVPPSAMEREREDRQLRQAEEQLERAIDESPDLRPLKDSLVVTNTDEGLQIQIRDQEGLPMFPRGSSDMHAHTSRLMDTIAKVIVKMPQRVSITGHTDATPYAAASGYGNWELSADRANAARRALIGLGLPEQRIERVVGRAATEPLLRDDPAAPANRRLSVVLLRATTDRHRSAQPPS